MIEQTQCCPQGFLEPLRAVPHHSQAAASGGAIFWKGCQEQSANRLERLQHGPDIVLLIGGPGEEMKHRPVVPDGIGMLGQGGCEDGGLQLPHRSGA